MLVENMEGSTIKYQALERDGRWKIASSTNWIGGLVGVRAVLAFVLRQETTGRHYVPNFMCLEKKPQNQVHLML